MIYSAQIRAARALIGWTQGDLAKRSGLGAATIKRLELADGPISGNVSTERAIMAALESAGVIFIDAGEDSGFGVKLRRLARSRRRR
jgi:transcriptional regulator with XRE-family HTH domain